MRGGFGVVMAATLLACPADRGHIVEEVEVGRPAVEAKVEAEAADDPRLVCVREHASDPAHATVVRALCAELHDLGGVSASVAIVQEDRVVFATAVGPRCRGGGELLGSGVALRIGSITKLVTAALAVMVAERSGVGLDDPLVGELPELVPAVTLRGLMTHTSGLRDPDPMEMLASGEAWLEVLQRHRGEVGGEHGYANANFLVVGRWLERSTGRGFVELVAEEQGLAGVRELVSFEVGKEGGTSGSACGHRAGAEWEPIELAAEPPLPVWTIPAGGGFASVEDLARLPFALERAGVLTRMLATRVPSDQPGWDYGLGVRMQGEGEALVLAHSGNTGTHWAELKWSPKHRVAVAVLSTTPQAFKATLHAAFEAALAEDTEP